MAAVSRAGSGVTVLEGGGDAGRRQIEALQVSGRSVLGALAFNTGGLLIDDGWLRVLGCGHPRCGLSISGATALVARWGSEGSPSGVVVGIDVLGGVFAIDGRDGDRATGSPSHVHYFAPDSLRWEGLGMGHGAWVFAMLESEARGKFYKDLRWDRWQIEVAALSDNQGISVAPPLFSAESRPIERTSRRGVPLKEVIGMGFDFARQLGP